MRRLAGSRCRAETGAEVCTATPYCWRKCSFINAMTRAGEVGWLRGTDWLDENWIGSNTTPKWRSSR